MERRDRIIVIVTCKKDIFQSDGSVSGNFFAFLQV